MRFPSAASALILCAGSGCFPYLEVYRPDTAGVVSVPAPHVAASVHVEACSASRWTGMGDGCPREIETFTDSRGAFHFAELREWSSCCLGEAPLPVTEVNACTRDGWGATGVVAGGKVELLLRPLELEGVPERLRRRCAAFVLGR